MKLKIFLVAGARPNFMKIAPLYDEMKKHPAAFEPIIVHTGQHYDENMSKVFFDDLELPRPDIYLDVGSGTHAEQTAEIMKRFEPQLLRHQPELVIVVGDVNSTLACALTAVKMRMPSDNLRRVWERYEHFIQNRKTENENRKFKARVRSGEAPILAHVEAGERSFDCSMPEEINRVTTDVLSDILFTTCGDSDDNLLAEGINPRTIFRVGNIMIDSLQKFLPKAAQSNFLKKSPLTKGDKGGYEDFALVTLHRPGNVDDPSTLAAILSALVRISARVPIIFPMHPRTRKLMANLDPTLRQRVAQSQILITDPLGYLDFLHLQTQARLVLTDSGGVQVETSYLGIPCLTLRKATEWQITLREGTNQLVIPKEDEIVQAANSIFSKSKFQPARIKFWDGHTAERIVEILQNLF
jgi:UDP-N-acetylglucosamine 2-epimerase (non-hydrolysing)